MKFEIIMSLMMLMLIAFSSTNIIHEAAYCNEYFHFSIDGLKEDWVGFEPRVEDPKDDAIEDKDGTDIKAVYAEFDKENLYIMFEMWEKPAQVDYSICIDVNEDLDFDFVFGFNSEYAWDYDDDLVLNNIPCAIKEIAEIALPLSLVGNQDYIIIFPFVYLEDFIPDFTNMFDINFKENDYRIYNEKPNYYKILDVPQIRQEENWCGPASLTIVMNYWGSDTTQKEIGNTIDPKHNGTTTDELIEIADEHGFKVFKFQKSIRRSYAFRNSIMDELKAWISHDYPTIITQYFWNEEECNWEGHFSVVVGYDNRVIHIVDPIVGELELEYNEFEESWEYADWSLIVIPKNSTTDSDDDGLEDLREIETGTDPFNKDSDGDGVSDSIEIDKGEDPLRKRALDAQTADLNGDEKVNFIDLAILGRAYGKKLGEIGYVSSADLNNDNIVDYKDLAIMAANYEIG